MSRFSPLREVAVLFLRLGLTAFGGPAAHVAIIEEECVRRRQWLTREQFLDVLGAANLIPGPTSTELAMHVGLRRAGWPGLLVAGVSFIVPAALVVGVLAAVYSEAGRLPAFDGVLRAVKPVVVVVVLQALIGLSRTALRSTRTVIVSLASLAAVALGASEIFVLLGAGVLSAAGGRSWRPAATVAVCIAAGATATVAAAATAAGISVAVALPSLFAYFVKAGSAIFGSGYVLLALLRSDLVAGSHWLTEGQLLDAIAVGQITPGPVFTTATFIGFLLGGPAGAAVATAGIFLPSFVFTALSAGVLHRLQDSAAARRFLDGVSGAAVALIALVTWTLAQAAVTDMTMAALAVSAAVLVGWFRLNSSWALAGAAAIGAWLL